MILAPAIGSAFVAATIYLCYGFADRLAGIIGPTGMNGWEALIGAAFVAMLHRT